MNKPTNLVEPKPGDPVPAISAVAVLAFALIVFWAISQRSPQKDPFEGLDLGCPNPVCDCQECDCGDDCTCNTYVQPPPDEAGSKPPAQPVVALSDKPELAMHSIANCPQCVIDKSKIPEWLSKGWRVVVYDDGCGESGKIYPWYEVTEMDGRKYSFVGPLSSDKIERERRNAAGASR